MKFLTMHNLNIYSFRKKIFWKSSELVHMGLWDLANQSFYESGISNVWLKLTWEVGERLLASD